MTDYFCRVSCDYERLRPVFEKLSNNIIAYEHNEDALNVHVHFLIEQLKESTDTLKNWIRKLTAQKFKADEWSFKKKYKPNKLAPEIPVSRSCITYMAKGKLEPCYNKGFKEEDILDYKLKWIDYKRSAKQQALTSYIVKESVSQSKLRQDQMIQEIIRRLDTSPLENVDKFNYELETVRVIRQVVIIENKTMLGRYKLRDYYDTVLAHRDPKSWLSKMSQMVHFKD